MAERPATELPDSLEWVNSDIGASLAGYRGKVVAILFWTYSNSQSLKTLPLMRQLEHEFENGVVIVGIHCPKYPHQENARNVLKAVNRHFIRFPVASDPDFAVWRDYDIEAWPSIALVDAEGNHRATLLGDGMADDLMATVAKLLEEAAEKEIRDYGRVATVRRPESTGVLRFPTGVLEARGLLYVADAGNNRILEISKAGRIQRIFGSGNPGFWDGVLANCGFNMPRGMAYADNYLYVADTNNHAIRRINLFDGEVETMLGNGRPGVEVTRSTRRLRDVGLSMPVGLTFDGPELYISSAGLGQIWRLDLGTGVVGWFTGTGQAEVVDGEPIVAGFVQPLGMAVSEGMIYVADADGSAIREVRCETGHVQSRVGQNSFVYGMQDGPGSTALLQYPMDVAIRARSEELWVADSFNNCIRVIDTGSGAVSTPEIEQDFAEPAGISVAGNTLWVANTNAHEIVKVDMVSRTCRVIGIEEAG